ncbi:hypothetical protein TNCT_521911 [Trichonephila clavata]|uniref:Uncharacterized protein n=1 Tax=Trichonephila clavata TaxID=2740835 RepID=A0A8X6HXI3_TRICU|nr:hypothetical protein TNCT_521911 [Trichonephila clavata]
MESSRKEYNLILNPREKKISRSPSIKTRLSWADVKNQTPLNQRPVASKGFMHSTPEVKLMRRTERQRTDHYPDMLIHEFTSSTPSESNHNDPECRGKGCLRSL